MFRFITPKSISRQTPALHNTETSTWSIELSTHWDEFIANWDHTSIINSWTPHLGQFVPCNSLKCGHDAMKNCLMGKPHSIIDCATEQDSMLTILSNQEEWRLRELWRLGHTHRGLDSDIRALQMGRNPSFRRHRSSLILSLVLEATLWEPTLGKRLPFWYSLCIVSWQFSPQCSRSQKTTWHPNWHLARSWSKKSSPGEPVNKWNSPLDPACIDQETFLDSAYGGIKTGVIKAAWLLHISTANY